MISMLKKTPDQTARQIFPLVDSCALFRFRARCSFKFCCLLFFPFFFFYPSRTFSPCNTAHIAQKKRACAVKKLCSKKLFEHHIQKNVAWHLFPGIFANKSKAGAFSGARTVRGFIGVLRNLREENMRQCKRLSNEERRPCFFVG